MFFSSSISLGAYKVTGQFPWSSLRETDRGVSAELTVKTPSHRYKSLRSRWPSLPTVKLSEVHVASGLFCIWFFSVSIVEDPPDPEVGGCVEGTGLSGSWSLLCSPGGEWPFPQVLPVGECCSVSSRDASGGALTV